MLKFLCLNYFFSGKKSYRTGMVAEMLQKLQFLLYVLYSCYVKFIFVIYVIFMLCVLLYNYCIFICTLNVFKFVLHFCFHIIWFLIYVITLLFSLYEQNYHKKILIIIITQPANFGLQDVTRTSTSNVPRTSPIDPIWSSWGRPDLTSRGRPNLTSWGRPEMTSRGRLNLTFKGRPWEVDSGRPLEDLQSTQTWMSNFFLTFLSELIRLTKSKSISTLKVYWEPSKTSKIEHFLEN